MFLDGRAPSLARCRQARARGPAVQRPGNL